MGTEFDMWNEKWSELMDTDGLDPEKAAYVADAHVLRELINRAK